ncbi:hypothetical protein DFP72DRAFT_906847 [Ephemerocybe angulata]|uniref:Uncharacterized protein n=1 Tax=Ephemerocybe angulata TaxID=980116 RepID=A0A8H6HSN3_9AGAR|nr:hypothetical protein DFP72DRAFT_906847 [Tulosesus angulatus]
MQRRRGVPATGNNVRLPLMSVSEAVVPLFSRRPPWWARNPGTAGLLLCDLIVTGAFIELTWSHWTEATIIPPPEPLPTDPPYSPSNPAPQATVEWNLRPTWQRSGLCAAHFLFGCFFAGGLLGLKSQFIRSVTVVPSKAAAQAASSSASSTASAAAQAAHKRFSSTSARDLPKTAIIQNASHPTNTGWEFPLRTAWLEEGRDKGELLLRSGEIGSRWYLNLQDAKINGKECVSKDEARSLLLNAWKAVQPAALPTKGTRKA